MLQGDEEACSTQCDSYYAMVDTFTTVESLIVETTVEPEEYSRERNDTSSKDADWDVPFLVDEASWRNLEVKLSEKESTTAQFEDVYQPNPVWQRPPGQAVQGVDAFKLRCHVNCLKEPAAVVVGDSGAAPTLISEKFHSMEVGIYHGILFADYAWDNPYNAYTSFFLFFWDTLKNPFWGTIKQFNSVQILLYPTNNQLSYPTVGHRRKINVIYKTLFTCVNYSKKM